MSAVDDFLTPLLLKGEALRQKAALSCYRDLATIDDARSGLQVLMRHSEALGEGVGALFCAEAHKILSLSHGNTLEAQKACGLLLLILTCGLDGRMTQDEKLIHFTSGDDLSPEYLLRAEPDPMVKRQLLERWKRAVNAMLHRQMALLELELDQPRERRPAKPATNSKSDSKSEIDSSKEVPLPKTQDPKRGPLILLIEAARAFDLHKGSLTKARQKDPGTWGYLESFSDGKNVWVYRNDVRTIAKHLQGVRRKNSSSL